MLSPAAPELDTANKNHSQAFDQTRVSEPQKGSQATFSRSSSWVVCVVKC